jgi:hypothetical protein
MYEKCPRISIFQQLAKGTRIAPVISVKIVRICVSVRSGHPLLSNCKTKQAQNSIERSDTMKSRIYLFIFLVLLTAMVVALQVAAQNTMQ